MNVTVIDTGQIHAELTKQINRIRSAAAIGATGWISAEILADRAEQVWRTDFPNLAKLLDSIPPITIESQTS